MSRSSERNILLGVIAFAAVAMVAAVLLPQRRGDPVQSLPWQIEHTENGTRVFGLVPGFSTIGAAEARLHEQAEISLFVSPQGRYAVEAYFDHVALGNLSAKVVLAAALPQPELHAMFERGLRVSKLASGRKVELRPADAERVRLAPIASLTYLPAARLDDALIARRFGAPAQRLRETESGTLHWLYPRLGLDITVSAQNRAVLQYVHPRDFPLLVEPLAAQSEVLR